MSVCSGEVTLGLTAVATAAVDVAAVADAGIVEDIVLDADARGGVPGSGGGERLMPALGFGAGGVESVVVEHASVGRQSQGIQPVQR